MTDIEMRSTLLDKPVASITVVSRLPIGKYLTFWLAVFILIFVTCSVYASQKSQLTDPGVSPDVLGSGIDWIQDDYAAALEVSRRESKPIVIDMWAPWCHSCLSMQHTTLVDPGLRPLVDRFVWLAIDTDKKANAFLLEKFSISAWPTFVVISPVDESVQARHLGTASVAQFRNFALAGALGHQDMIARNDDPDPTDPARLVRRGDRAALAGDPAGAAKAYGEALAKAPADWGRRSDVVAARIGSLFESGDLGGCVDLALASVAHMGNGVSVVVALSYAGFCIDQLPADDPRRANLTALALEQLGQLVEDRTAPLSLDDRSDVLFLQREYYDRAGGTESARSAALRQRMLLDKAAAEASSAHEASIYNWPRTEVYVYLGVGAELISDLEASEKALPKEYDPPYRLSWLYSKLNNPEAALAAAKRALERAYGLNKARIQGKVAKLYGELGDKSAEREARSAELALYEALPPGQKDPEAEKRVRDALVSLGKK